MTENSVYTYGPDDGPVVLAIHGMTGHGRRWRAWSEHLPQARVVAPDLIGHGRARSTPPWNIEAQVELLERAITDHAPGPVVVVAHSYGGALAVHLARTAPSRVSGLVLLDPAIGLDSETMLSIAHSTATHHDYTDEAEARSEKIHGAWNDVDPRLLDEEVAEHLIPTENGRVGWRTSMPALVASWGELARPVVVPPPHIPVTVVRAARVQPPYVGEPFLDALARDGRRFELLDFDCDHMVPQARGPESAALVARMLETVGAR